MKITFKWLKALFPKKPLPSVKELQETFVKKLTKDNSYTCPHSGDTFEPGQLAFIAHPHDKGKDSRPLRQYGNQLIQVLPCQVTGDQLAHFKTIESFNEWNFWFQCPQSGNKFRRGEVAYCCYVENRGRSTNQPFVTGMTGIMNLEFAYFRNVEEFTKWNDHERNG